MKTGLIALAVGLVLWAGGAAAESASDLQAARPDLFDPENGYRVAKYRAPSPDDIPGPSTPITAHEAMSLVSAGALAIDVFGAGQNARIDPETGKWLISRVRDTLPGAVWLPEVGRGAIDDDMAGYLAITLEKLSYGDQARTIVVFCRADCWMSWNAAQRIADLGYSDVRWLRNGTDGWQDIGGPLIRVEPLPVPVK